MDDQTRTLLERARRNDAGALSKLFERHRDRLQAAVRRSLGERYRVAVGDSEDAAQDAILGVLRRLDGFDWRGQGSFLAWMLRHAENEVRNRLRAAGRLKRGALRVEALDTEAAVPLADDASPSEAAIRREDEARIRACIEKLPERERDVILLRRYLDLSMDEIAAELDLPSAGAARALLSRAQARLATMLAPDGD